MKRKSRTPTRLIAIGPTGFPGQITLELWQKQACIILLEVNKAAMPQIRLNVKGIAPFLKSVH